MYKTKFIKKLRKALRWIFSEEEIADILSDYEGFFASGDSEGKNEAQICAELGSPAVVAQELAETMGRKKRITTRIKLRILLAAVFVVAVIPINITYYEGNSFRFSIAFITVFTVFLWFILGGTVGKTPSTLRILGKNGNWLLMAGHVLIFAFALVCFLWAINADFVISDSTMKHMDIFMRIWVASIAAVLCIAVFAVFGFYRLTPYFFTLIIHAVGAVVFLYAILWIFKRLEDAAGFIPVMMKALMIYGYAALLMGLSALCIYFIQKRRAE
ncbi:MAG: DUF1700 domain-containing protein [Oscillospiraceae bacterium]|jgi:uncharacterized membrane protein|nr:DUF1700 domain-containing protein [Oscillospiraceae bacterium]